MNIEQMEERIKSFEKMIRDHSIGVANVYNEMEKLRNRFDQKAEITKELEKRCLFEMIPIDETILRLKIKSYPMNIIVFIEIETNIGEISYEFDFPPFHEENLSHVIDKYYFSLLRELHDAHENRGGIYPDTKSGCDWMDENGRTIIKKEKTLIRKGC